MFGFGRRRRRYCASLATVAWLGLGCRPSPPPSDPEPAETSTKPVGASQGSQTKTPRPPAPQPVASRDQALHAVVTGNHQGALPFLQRALRQTPADDILRLALARALALGGDVKQAVGVLLDGSGAMRNLVLTDAAVTLLARQGHLPQAHKLIDAALRAQPAALELMGLRLALWQTTGEVDRPQAKVLADKLYDAYEAGNATTASELLAVAQAALIRGTSGAFTDANMVLGEAETKLTSTTGSWIGERILLLRAAMFAEKYASTSAHETYALMLARDPWHPDALAGSAAVELDELHFATARELALRALMINGQHPVAHAVLASIALVEGRRSAATARAQRSLEANNLQSMALAVLAAVSIQRRDAKQYASWRGQAQSIHPGNRHFFRRLVDLLVFLHLYDDAATVFEEALALIPNDAHLHGAHGLNLLRQGHEAQGREALKRAWSRDRFNERTYNVLELYERKVDADYITVQRGSTTLRMLRENHALLAPELFDLVGDARATLDRAYNMEAGPLQLEFYRGPREFSVRTAGVPSIGAVAVCFGRVITAVGPYAGTHNLRQVIWHELAHVYALRHSEGRVPRWFTEGLSEWESELADPSWARESAALLRQTKTLPGLSNLELAFVRARTPRDMEIAYTMSAWAVRYLGETFGRPRLVKMLRAFAKGWPTSKVVHEVTGKTLDQLDQVFQPWLAGELAARQHGWSPDQADAADDSRTRLFAKANAALDVGNHDSAREILEQLIAKGGDGFAVQLSLARAAALTKRVNQAFCPFATGAILRPRIHRAACAQSQDCPRTTGHRPRARCAAKSHGN